MRWIAVTFVLLGMWTPNSWSGEAPPRTLDPRLKIELYAQLPPTGSPTGIDIDELGRVWVVEIHSDCEAQGGEAHPNDRILVLSDTDGDGKTDQTDVFADGLECATSVAVRPLWLLTRTADGTPRRSVYVATKDALLLLHDEDGDQQAGRREVIARAQTVGDAAHHGFYGLAFDPLGDLYFGFSGTLENDYQLFGVDNKSLQGAKGDGGGLFRSRVDRTQLSRVARGFCNSQAICFDGYGRFFAVDQHGDSHHSGRLLHVIPEGDYGFRSRNGNRVEHPFTSWNGEIPGTLPMVAHTGAAPGGVVVYESDGLPEDYLGNLLVTSQVDHRIDRFRLNSRGTSLASAGEALIVGGDSFQPLGLASAPDGRVYCTDIGARNGSLNDQGRIWMISAVEPPLPRTLAIDVESMSTDDLTQTLTDRRLSVRRLAARKLARSPDTWATVGEDLRLQDNSRSVLELHWAPCAANGHSEQPPTIPGEPFLRFDEFKPTSTWLLLQPLMRKPPRTLKHPVTTQEEYQRLHFRTCEELLATTLRGEAMTSSIRLPGWPICLMAA